MNKVLFSSKSVSWDTPFELFQELDREFHFTLDLCADSSNHLCSNYYSEDDSCFNHFPMNEVIFCNPPYSRSMYKFIEFCSFLSKYNIVVLLLPSRTDVRWFHDFIYNKCEIRFLKGRLHFSNSKLSAPFPSMVCVMR